jgi:hypothetical protein
MPHYLGGFIVIVNYAVGDLSRQEDFAILTESSLDILTETSVPLEIESM